MLPNKLSFDDCATGFMCVCIICGKGLIVNSIIYNFTNRELVHWVHLCMKIICFAYLQCITNI